MARIFLCYAPEDETQVREIHSRLRQKGFQPWMDKQNLSPGQNRRREIRRTLGVSDFMLIFFSSTSVARKGYLQEDFQYALTCLETIPEGKIGIIPVRIDSCDLPSSVQHLSLQHLFGADLFEPDGFEKIVQALREGMATRPRPELVCRARLYVRRLLWFSLVLFVAIELALVMLTGYYGWDTMEPWVYFLGVLLPLGMYGYFVYTTHEFSPRVFYEQRVAARLAKLALSHSSAEIHQQRTPPSVSAPPIMPSPHTPTPEPSEPPATFTNSIGMEFVLIRPGIFMMGTPTEQLGEIASGHKDHRDWIENETPQHQVEISQPFYLGKYPVTQRQWEMVMGDNPSNFKGNNLPVERVSWDNAQEFIKKLNEREGDSHYLLPTEAQWEYACRAGSTGLYSFGDEMSRLGEYAWYNENSDGKTHPVGEKKPNAWGLYDMHGNVWEWVQDWYDESYYQNSPNVDPQGPNAGARRVLRGGGWDGLARLARSALRGRDGSSSRSGSVGFRCAMSVPSK